MNDNSIISKQVLDSKDPNDIESVLSRDVINSNSDYQNNFRKFKQSSYPETGIFKEYNIYYDLLSFEKFYSLYHKKFLAKSIKTINLDLEGREKIIYNYLTDYELTDMQGNKLPVYSEVACNLLITIDTLGNDIKVAAPSGALLGKGTSYIYNSIFIEDFFKHTTLQQHSYRADIHIHPEAGEYLIQRRNTQIRDKITVPYGPSLTDFGSHNGGIIRNIIIDKEYIYLYNKRINETIYIKR